MNPGSSTVAEPHPPDKPTAAPRVIPAVPVQPSVPIQPLVPTNSTSSQPSAVPIQSILEAQKHAKYAVSALSYEDVKTAVENLEKALSFLKNS